MGEEKITSLQNPHVKKVVQLREKKRRDETGLTIVEGCREVARAWKAETPFEHLFVCRDFFSQNGQETIVQEAVKKGVPVTETDKKVFAKISFGAREEGVLAVCAPKRTALADLRLSKTPLIVVVEKVEKPGNLGAIMRTCDGAGVDALILSDAVTDLYNPNVVRASLGTVFSLRIACGPNGNVLRFLKENSIKTCATIPDAKTVYTDEKFGAATAVVLGSEEKGLSDFWIKNADVKVKIPMAGVADSLNVSSTAAVMIYEVIRQRQG